jgi:NADPH:quinone reductase-like Zn-dependent oxidoreductase
MSLIIYTAKQIKNNNSKRKKFMKAMQLTTYDKNNITLDLVQVEKPEINARQVLLKVTAAGVNPLDNMISRGEVKLIVPYKIPLIPGNEVVGIVEAIGEQVSGFEEGERVYARLPLDSIGAFAEYVAVDYSALAKVPDYLSDIEAAAVPLTALTVFQAFELMQVKRGKTIFISGGTGGLGAMAIPLAKAKGLTVITSGNAANEQRVLDLGADRFINYQTDDYSKLLSNVDYVLDTLGGKETEKQMTILKKGGQIVSLKGMPNIAFAKHAHIKISRRI